jgi:hypothetical protein
MTYYTKDELAEKIDLDDSVDQVPDTSTRDETVTNVEQRNINVRVCNTRVEAREYLIECIPAGATVMNGRSTTLHEIGFLDDLEQEDGFTYLGNEIRQIDDADERHAARREALTADVFFDSPNAIARTGEFIGVNGVGTGVGAWPYAAKHLVLVAGANKIVSSIETAVRRVREFAYPLENERVQRAEGHESVIGKLIQYEYERQDDRTELVLIDDNLGY